MLNNSLKKLKRLIRKPPLPKWDYSSFSQHGEDMILRALFDVNPPDSNFYVDVGAHHPQRFSNTYYFYLQGWAGLNIDAMPGSMAEFKKARPRDINVEAAVSDVPEDLTFYIYNEPALNTFSSELVKSRSNIERYKVLEERRIRTVTLTELLANHLSPGQRIGFLSIDVEGLDERILNSVDWARFSPSYVITEIGWPDDSGSPNVPTNDYMKRVGYRLVGRTVGTSIFHRIK
jgi:FkbM family methyltransferase